MQSCQNSFGKCASHLQLRKCGKLDHVLQVVKELEGIVTKDRADLDALIKPAAAIKSTDRFLLLFFFFSSLFSLFFSLSFPSSFPLPLLHI